MKIAMLNISIGKYDVFWKDFYLTAEKNFLPGHEKKYFVFTDNISIYGADFDNINVIFQENLGWPYNTMKRFHMFKKIISRLQCYDYIFFVNSNALFVQKLTDKFINAEKNIITIIHPGLYGTDINDMPYERNPESNAYIPVGKGAFYVQGAFIGGKSDAFIQMTEKLCIMTEEDLSDNIVAVWHDESFLNKYILDRKDVQVMGRQYLYYEEYVFPYKPVILLRNKRNYGDLGKFRGLTANRKKEVKEHIKLTLRNLVYRCLICLHIKKTVKYITEDGHYLDTDLNLEKQNEY